MPRGDGETLRAWIDAVCYAGTVAAVAFGASLSIAVVTGGDLVRAKFLLFVAGWVLLGYATVRLWPRSVDESRSPGAPSISGNPAATRFQSVVLAVTPMRWIRPPPPRHRIALPTKLFLGAVFVLLLSFLMETAFGVS